MQPPSAASAAPRILPRRLTGPRSARLFGPGTGGTASGGWRPCRRKMMDHQANGARLGWLLISAERAVEAFRLEVGEAFPGLVIDLAEIWAG